jgi:intracellular sulfur oxidation DsrE/DsrF family protein
MFLHTLWGNFRSMAETREDGPRAAGVVVHLDEADPGKHEAVLGNIANLLAELGEATVIELVVHGPGLAAALSGSPHAAETRRLIGRGVSVAACGNTMRREGVRPDRLIEGVSVVPAGLAQIVRRQRDGWAYVRP